MQLTTTQMLSMKYMRIQRRTCPKTSHKAQNYVENCLSMATLRYAHSSHRFHSPPWGIPFILGFPFGWPRNWSTLVYSYHVQLILARVILCAMFMLVVCPSLTPFRLRNTGPSRSSTSPRSTITNMLASFIAAPSSMTENDVTSWLSRPAVATSSPSCSSYFLAPSLASFSRSAQFGRSMPRSPHYPLKIANWDSAVSAPEQNLSSYLLDVSYAVPRSSRTSLGPTSILSWTL